MKIMLTDAGKRFNRDWIFRRLSYEFNTGHSYAIIGPNGSGKSTLLQVIAGAIAASEGKVEYSMADGREPSSVNCQLSTEKVYRYLSFSAPYLELIEEMTLVEFLRFHQVFKPFFPSFSPDRVIDLIELRDSAHKQIRYYSSGMKQRVKLAQAIFSFTPIILLDEPCTNLDAPGIALYHNLMNEFASDRLVIVSSNDEQEYDFCEKRIDMMSYKK
ncbi:MAG TPA: ATP-binding cassette domain-containing protein [Puia sp.]|nr:ATP-binding cassette domain-containing protein [Puia sp.]